jgi:hypothetical protein
MTFAGRAVHARANLSARGDTHRAAFRSAKSLGRGERLTESQSRRRASYASRQSGVEGRRVRVSAQGGVLA